MDNYRKPLQVACETARFAGEMLRKEFHQPGGPRGHGDHADIDEEVEREIRARLLGAFPDWGYRGEETGHSAGAGEYMWLVDPNDGTASYLKGRRGSSVSIAGLHRGIPVVGVVYAYAYPDDRGDFIAWAEGEPLSRNGNVVQPKPASTLSSSSIVIVSQNADDNAVGNAECVAPARFLASTSVAYRLARTAVGDGIAGVSLTNTNSWDFAAGHALLRGAGMTLVDSEGNEPTYRVRDGQSIMHFTFSGKKDIIEELRKRNWERALERPPSPAPPYCLFRPHVGRHIASVDILDRSQGCLLGQLAGDSLGSLVEFAEPKEIVKRYPNGIRELADGGTWHILAGQPTDDSEMALMLARTLVHRGQYDPEAVLSGYVHWYRSRPFDMGFTTSKALNAAGLGKSHQERCSGIQQQGSRDSQANGSLMRISPLGIFCTTCPDRAADWAREDSRFTHLHAVCQDACAAYSTAIAVGIATGSAGDSFHAALKCAQRPEVQRALEAARMFPPADYLSQMGWVLIALQNAFYQLLHATSFEEGLVRTVMEGGDTDTNGAIAGALLGAIHGRSAIPSQWLLAVQSCRPLLPVVQWTNQHPRPMEFWPVDVFELAEELAMGPRQ